MANLYELQGTMYQIEQVLDENGGELTEELAELLTDTELSIRQKADGYRAVMAKFSDKEIKRLQSIKKAAKNAKENLKGYILNVMGTYGIKKIEGELCSMTRTTTTSLDVNEEILLAQYAEKIAEFQATLPEFLTVDIKVSKTAIKNKFKDTDVLPAGCNYVENDSLRIR